MSDVFPVIDVFGDPFEMGRQHGASAARAIGRGVGFYRSLLVGHGAVADFLDAKLAATAAAFPPLYEELAGVAAGAGVSPADVMLLNARSELMSIGWQGQRVLECTAVAVEAGRHESGAVVGQTWDWLPAVADNMVVVRGRPATGPAFVTFAEAGQLGKIGLGEELAVCLNFLHCPPGEWGLAAAGVPVHLLARAVLGSTIAGAVALLRSVGRGGAVSLVMAGKAGDVAGVEVSPARVDVLQPVDGLVVHANSFECPARPDALPPDPRCRQVRRMLAGGRVTDADLWGVFSHHDGTGRICHHPTDDVGMTATLAAAVVRPTEGITLRRGPTCRHLVGQDVRLPSAISRH